MDGLWLRSDPAPRVIPHPRVPKAGLGFGVTPMLVCPEGLWLGVGPG